MVLVLLVYGASQAVVLSQYDRYDVFFNSLIMACTAFSLFGYLIRSYVIFILMVPFIYKLIEVPPWEWSSAYQLGLLIGMMVTSAGVTFYLSKQRREEKPFLLGSIPINSNKLMAIFLFVIVGLLFKYYFTESHVDFKVKMKEKLAPMKMCNIDSDCVLLENRDCSAGPFSGLAINSKFVKEVSELSKRYYKKIKKENCFYIVTENYKGLPFCDQGICKIKETKE
jgi:hypothetical protein